MSTDGSKFRNSDLPAVEDRLGTEKQRDGLVRFMRECSTPMTIAVQGDWGTGKTSMMQLLQKQLEDENGCTLWFPTWQFAVLGEQDRLLMDLVIMLCHRLEEKYSKVFDKKSDKIKEEIKKKKERILHAVGMTTLSLLAETAKTVTGVDFSNILGTAISDLKDSDTKKKADYISYPVLISGLDDDLKSLIDLYLGENKAKRLYIFIDDLDRLEPVRAVELLEGIKNFLDIPRCVFMLAVDTNIIKEGLHQKYGKNIDTRIQLHFFDKIIQVPYKLPTHNYDLQSYVENVLEGYDEANADKYVKFLKNASIRNPRTIKRCVNFCLLYKCMDDINTIDGADKDMYLHRFAIKLLELEQENLYFELLSAAIEDDEQHNSLIHVIDIHIGKEEMVSKILDAVLDCFNINSSGDNSYNINNIFLFAEFIRKSAPPYIISESIAYAQMYKAICDRINIKKHKYIPELAQDLENTNFISSTIHKNGFRIRILCYNKLIAGTKSPLMIQINHCTLSEHRLFLGVMCCKMDGLPHFHDDRLIYEKVDNNYFICNILNTSSPDAPIYQVLRNAGIIT